MNADMLNRGTEDRPLPSLSLFFFFFFFFFFKGGGGRTSHSPPLDPPLITHSYIQNAKTIIHKTKL